MIICFPSRDPSPVFVSVLHLSPYITDNQGVSVLSYMSQKKEKKMHVS